MLCNKPGLLPMDEVTLLRNSHYFGIGSGQEILGKIQIARIPQFGFSPLPFIAPLLNNRLLNRVLEIILSATMGLLKE